MGTFQKYYTQTELKEYLETQLGVEAIPATLGVYYLFKDETLQQQALARRYRRVPATPKKTFSELTFDENRELLEPLLSRVLELARLPVSPMAYRKGRGKLDMVCPRFSHSRLTRVRRCREYG